MFRVKISDKKELSVRFHRSGDETSCEIMVGKYDAKIEEMQSLASAKCRRMQGDKYDKCVGHLLSLSRATKEMKRKDRKKIFAAYADWAKRQGVRTSINLNRVGI